MKSFRDRITETTGARVDSYRASREGWNPAKSLTKVLEQARREYEDRFLYELVQNAHDAHADGTEGEISILLAGAEGEHGVLYVANRGNPFDEPDFKAICDLAMSDKAPGEAIGNKGVGFKSVLQVCRWPEIYSRQAVGSSGFDGYCFTFARPDQFESLTDGDARLAQDMRDDVSPYFLPVPAQHSGEVLADFEARGFATVMRFPLKSGSALTLTLERLERLGDATVPVQLFLERLDRFEIVIRDCGDDHPSVALKRRSTAIPDPVGDDAQRYEMVDLEEQGKWFVSSRRITADEMREAIQVTVDDEELEESWTAWDSEAWVSVAVRVDGGSTEPRIYTYLPMEAEASSPLHGHLHAPFSTKLARTAVNESVHLNSYLLDRTAIAAAAAVTAFAADEEVLPPAALVDLLVWDEDHRDRVVSAHETIGLDLESAPLVPIHPLEDGTSRSSLASCQAWPFDTSLMDARNLARDAGAELVADSIRGERLSRLEDFALEYLDRPLQVRPSASALWAESFAQALLSRRSKPATWGRFYGDLAVVFDESAFALRGRSILLGDDGRLHPPPDDGGDLEQALVFFPPARERTDEDDEVEGDFDLKPPASLRKSLILMSEELSWNRKEGRTRKATPARRFLQENNLVKRFKTADLLEHVGVALRRSRSKAVSADSLKFTYNLFASSRNVKPEDLRDLGLRVPCKIGWVAADEAFFGRGWGRSEGDDLASLVEKTEALSPTLAALGSRTIPGPEDWPFRVRDPKVLVSFLKSVGVRDGIWPEELPRADEQVVGSSISPGFLADRFSLGEREAKLWTDAVERAGVRAPNHPYTNYTAAPKPSILPGQDAYGKFDEGARRLFGRLVCAGLGRWPERLDISWKRSLPQYRSQPDEQNWPSPVRAFLEEERWIPSADGANRGETAFGRPEEVWFASGEEERSREFGMFTEPAVTRILGGDQDALRGAKSLGMSDWHDPEHSARLLAHLASMVGEEQVPESGSLSLRNALRRAWFMVAEADPERSGAVIGAAQLVLTVNGRLVARRADEITGSQVFVLGERVDTASRLLERSGVQILDVGRADPERVRDLVEDWFPAEFRTLESDSVEVRTPDGPFVPGAGDPKLTEGGTGWLTKLIFLVLEAKRLPFDHSGPKRREDVMAKLQQLRIRHVPSASIVVGDVEISDLQGAGRVLPVDDRNFPTLVSVGDEAPDPTRIDGLKVLAPALCEIIRVDAYQATIELALERLGSALPGEPAADDFARVLDLDAGIVTEALAHMDSPVVSLAELVAPVVAYYESEIEARRLLSQSAEVADGEDLAGLLGRFAPGIEDPAGVIASAREAGSESELREILELDFKRFNAALLALGPPYSPIHNEVGHAQALDYFLEKNRDEVLFGLRSRYLAAFLGGDFPMLEEYASVRDFEPLSPDESWLNEYDIPPDSVISSHVESWLEGFGETAEVPNGLGPVREVRATNRAVVARFLERAEPVIGAWANKEGRALPETWSGESAASDLREQLERSGTLDFLPLDETECIQWLARLGLWPEGMMKTVDLDGLGLGEADLEIPQEKKERERRERERQRRIVTLDGQEFDATRDGYSEILGHVRESVREELLATNIRTISLDLVPATTRGGSSGPGPGKGRRIKPRRLTNEQAAAVGLVGEGITYEWLRRRYPEECSPSSWKSAYREAIGEPPGDDTLGYDFEIVLKSRKVRFEVKATGGTDPRFEMGESEVGAARDSAGSNRLEYRIVFITEALDAERASLFVLPNPMDPAYRQFFAFPGTGLMCTFRPRDT